MTTVQGPTGVLRQCRECAAPAIDPFPPDWHIDLIKEGPETGPVRTFYTPHRADCGMGVPDPRPGIAVRVSGRYVAALAVQPPPVWPVVSPFVSIADAYPEAIGDWTEIGWITDGGFS